MTRWRAQCRRWSRTSPLLSARQVYSAHMEASVAFSPRYTQEAVLPFWEQLPWHERDKWQRTADELNAADREEAHL